MLDSVEPYGILVTVGDNDLFPLWYAQEVEGVRKDVLVVTTALLGTDWYASELMRSQARKVASGMTRSRGPPCTAVTHGQSQRSPSCT